MSTTADATRAVASCRPATGTPVTIPASAIDSTAEDYLQSLKRELDAAGYVPTELAVAADFEAECSLATQTEADRVRDYLHAAAFLGVNTVSLDVGSIADPGKVAPAVTALRERAQRDGLALQVEGLDARNL